MANNTSVAVGLSDTIRLGCRSMTTCLPSGAVRRAGNAGCGEAEGVAGCSLVAQEASMMTLSNDSSNAPTWRAKLIAGTLPGSLLCFVGAGTSVMLSVTNEAGRSGAVSS